MIEKFRLWLRRWLGVSEETITIDAHGRVRGLEGWDGGLDEAIARAAPGIIKASVAAYRRDEDRGY